jgi:phosphoglycerate dehydrogenase-like enzyme
VSGVGLQARGERVVVLTPPGQQGMLPLDALRAVAEVRVADSVEGLNRTLGGVDVLFLADFRTDLLARAWPSARDLRWIQTASIGVDAVLIPEVVGSDVVVTNTRGVFEQPIAEYVLALLLAFAKDLRRTLELQARREWSHRESQRLGGRRMVVLGAGPLAREIVLLARAVGVHVDVVGRRARDGEPGIGMVHGPGDLDPLLARADIVVLALPLTSDTYRLLDADRLARLRRGAWLVNVGRGATLDQDALIAALSTGQVAAAALDVFDVEPLPPAHPLWSTENVVISPHMSGDLVGWEEEVVRHFLDNLARWRAGDPLRDVVDKTGFQTA